MKIANRQALRQLRSHGDSRRVLVARVLAVLLLLAQWPATHAAEDLSASVDAGVSQPADTSAEVTAPPAEAPRIHVVYFPESEKARIRDEIRQEVLATLNREGWAEPGVVPKWVRNIKVSGDLRLRAQGDFLDAANDPAVNFAAINAGAPVDIFLPASSTPQKVLTIPYLNTTENRNAMRLRARLQLDTTIDEDIDAGLRLSTGSSSNPVSANQAFGHDFNKFSFLLDRAWLRYRTRGDYLLNITGGRMANPWQSATDLVWDNDLGFDGLTLRATPALAGSLNPYLSLGAFAMGNTDANYPSLSPFKAGSRDKWLLGVQTGIAMKTMNGFQLRSNLAVYDFSNLEGQASSLCYAPTDKVPCDTDNSRPGYSQKGNSMFALRVLNRPNPTTDPEYQYFGLASAFQVLHLNAGFDVGLFADVVAKVDVDLAHNLAFDRASIIAKSPANNFANCPATNPNCNPPWVGGADAWQLQLRVGKNKVVNAGDWDALFGYRYVESDAVFDGYTDSDFHLGGSNAQGIYLGGSLALAKNTVLAGKYMSATEVTGWHYAVDVLQIDLNVRF